MSTAHPTDDIAAYAADALPPDEAEAVRHHLAGCTTCREELDTHLETLAQLTPDGPAPDLWDRIAAATTPPAPGTAPHARPEDEGQQPHPIPRHRRHRHPGHRHRAWVRPAATGIAAAVLLFAGIGIGRTITRTEPDLARTAEDAFTGSDATVTVITTPEGDPAARIATTDEAAFIRLEGLPELPDDSTYQLWHLDDTEAISLAVLGNGTPDTVPIPSPRPRADLAITTEPAPGVTVATGPVVAQGTLEG